MRKNQTLEFSMRAIRNYCTNLDRPLTIWEALKEMGKFIDKSDPDISLPNLVHLFQTAEGARNDPTAPPWMAVIGLIHDLGKILFLKGCDEDGTSLNSQWAIVGDTFPVGCPLSPLCILPELNAIHSDTYRSKEGMYKRGEGFDSAYFAFGHDEYLYRVLDNPKNRTKHKLPPEALYIIRYHSFYPWFKEGAYKWLASEKDYAMLPLLKQFNTYDLYTKVDRDIGFEDIFESYKDLVEEWLGNETYWW